jgi:hypothetical protein
MQVRTVVAIGLFSLDSAQKFPVHIGEADYGIICSWQQLQYFCVLVLLRYGGNGIPRPRLCVNMYVGCRLLIVSSEWQIIIYEKMLERM